MGRGDILAADSDDVWKIGGEPSNWAVSNTGRASDWSRSQISTNEKPAPCRNPLENPQSPQETGGSPAVSGSISASGFISRGICHRGHTLLVILYRAAHSINHIISGYTLLGTWYSHTLFQSPYLQTLHKSRCISTHSLNAPSQSLSILSSLVS